MIVLTDEMADLAGLTDDNESHLYCCDPDRSLCGERLTGSFLDDDDPVECTRCEDIDSADAPCGAPLCRLRQVARSWWPW